MGCASAFFVTLDLFFLIATIILDVFEGTQLDPGKNTDAQTNLMSECASYDGYCPINLRQNWKRMYITTLAVLTTHAILQVLRIYSVWMGIKLRERKNIVVGAIISIILTIGSIILAVLGFPYYYMIYPIITTVFNFLYLIFLSLIQSSL